MLLYLNKNWQPQMGGELVFITGINHPRDEANLLQVLREAHPGGNQKVGYSYAIAEGFDFVAIASDLGLLMQAASGAVKALTISTVSSTAARIALR